MPTRNASDPAPGPTTTDARSIRSFVIRGGRITPAQELALGRLWPRYGLEFDRAPIDLGTAFGRNAPVTLEIGFGDGELLVTLAASHPERDFLGIEVHPPGVGHCLLAAEAAGITNLRVLRHDAVNVLEHSIAPGALDEVLIYFADPWPKKRHHKRRIIQAPFAELIAARLSIGGRLRLATDWEPYAEWMLNVLDANPRFRNAAGGGQYVARPDARPITKFERRGNRLGHVARDLEYLRVPD